MAIESQDNLQITASNLEALRSLAERAGMSLKAFTDESVCFGLSLAEMAIAEAPGKLHLTPEIAPGKIRDIYSVNFSLGENKSKVSEEQKAFMAAFGSETVHPLPLSSELLARVSDYAMLLCVERSDFVSSSIDMHWLWLEARQRDLDLLLQDPDGTFSVLGFGEIEEDGDLENGESS